MKIFGRKYRDEAGISILHEDGEPVTRIPGAAVYPVGSFLSADWEHPEGIVLTHEDCLILGIEIEGA